MSHVEWLAVFLGGGFAARVVSAWFLSIIRLVVSVTTRHL